MVERALTVQRATSTDLDAIETRESKASVGFHVPSASPEGVSSSRPARVMDLSKSDNAPNPVRHQS